MTLFWVLEELNRTEEAFAALEQRCRSGTDDHELKLFAADAFARHGKSEAAEQLLAAVKPVAHAGHWLRAAANIALYTGQRGQALDYWREVLVTEPQAFDAHQAVVQLLSDVEGVQAATRHLARTVEEWPHNYRLRQMYVYHLRHDDLRAARLAAQQLLEHSPADAWTYRELANIDTQLGQLDDALAEAEQAGSCSRTVRNRIRCSASCMPRRAGVTRRARRVGRRSADPSTKSIRLGC